MALWMTVEQEVFGLAAMLLVFSCAFVRIGVRGMGGEKSGRPAFFGKRIAGTVTGSMIVTVFFGCMVGMWRMEWEQSVIRREEALAAAYAGETVVVEGVVSEIGETDYGSRLVVEECYLLGGGPSGEAADGRIGEVSGEESSGQFGEVPEEQSSGLDSLYNLRKTSLVKIRKLYVYVDSDAGLKLGMTVRVEGELELAEPDRNPGQFDFRLYCLAKGICGSLQGDSAAVVDSKYLLVQEGLRQIGLLLERRLELIADKADVGLLKAILLGEKGDMDDDVYELYQKNGISHVLAISGLHVSVIGMGLWNGLRKAGVGYWSAGVAAFGMLFCYGSVAGFGPSVVRAVFMMGISFLAGAFGRTYDLPSAMSVPAMGLILRNPYVLTQASFQLSFLAVAAIFFPGAYLAKAWKIEGFWQNVWTSMSIQAVTLPVVLYHSFEIPVYGVVLNLVVVPLMTYVLVSGILGLAGSFVWMPMGPFLLSGAHYILALYKFACQLMERVTGAYLVLGRPSFGAMAVYYGCLFVGIWMVSRVKNAEHAATVVGIGKLAMFWLAGILALVPVPPSGLEVTFLDVGQGDGILLRAGAQTLLVDCGSSQERTLGEDCLVPFLKSQGIRRLDAVAVTHGDQDHINGVQYLLEDSACGIEIGHFIMPVTGLGDEACEELKHLAVLRGIPVSYVSADGVWTVEESSPTKQFRFWEGLLGEETALTCLHPGGTMDGGSMVATDRNDGSLVLKVEYGAFRMLLTGDVEAAGEQEMAENGLDGPVTVLKAAHHGSASSTSREFLGVVAPSYVVFSYGAGNRYGHPAEEVVERCLEAEAEIWETAKHGAIRIWTDGKKMQIRGWLDRWEGI